MQARLWHGVCIGLIGAALMGPAPAAQAQEGLAGPYLAATQADLRNDYAAAADYYDDTIQVRPDNAGLLNNAVVVNIIAGRIDRALVLAERLGQFDDDNQMMALALMAEALRTEDYGRALEIADNPEFRVNPLMSALVRGWSHVGLGEFSTAMDVFGGLEGSPALQAYGQLHHALALALAGDFAGAATLLDGDEDGPLHLNRIAMLTHIIALSQAERLEDATALARDALRGSRSDPELAAMLTALEAGEALPFDQLSSPADGAAAVYALLAGALTREEAGRLGLVYGRLAAHIRPEYDEVITLIGDGLTAQGQYELAATTYAEVAPASPWYVSAEIGRANALDGADRVDEAIEVLSHLSRAQPENQPVVIALGDILREQDQFERSAEAYERAVALIDEPAPVDWRLYYVRGISYERSGRWEQAEADFRKALELNPDQPMVLNYLGYSLVELRQNMDEALDMIERAVAQRPQDGYITDSLGWVLYRLGRYEEAVVQMERAVELLPIDPILNDHLGDVLWKVGRKTEAVFQWKRALSFEPTDTDAERIRLKLDLGLDEVLEREERAAAGEESEAEAALGE